MIFTQFGKYDESKVSRYNAILLYMAGIAANYIYYGDDKEKLRGFQTIDTLKEVTLEEIVEAFTFARDMTEMTFEIKEETK